MHDITIAPSAGVPGIRSAPPLVSVSFPLSVTLVSNCLLPVLPPGESWTAMIDLVDSGGFTCQSLAFFQDGTPWRIVPRGGKATESQHDITVDVRDFAMDGKKVTVEIKNGNSTGNRIIVRVTATMSDSTGANTFLVDPQVVLPPDKTATGPRM